MRSSKSFTLIELLIAVSIFAVVAIALYSTFSGGLKVWHRQEKGFKYSHSTRLVLDAMAKELRNAINYSVKQGLGAGLEGQGLRFIGDEKSLTFITLMGEEIAKVDYIFEEGVLKKRVVLQKEEFKEENQKESVLIENLDGLSFEYAYKGTGEGFELEWRKSWEKETVSDQPKIPAGVRITLTFDIDGKEEIIKKTVFIPMGTLEWGTTT